MTKKIKICEDCGPLPVNHLENWLADFIHLAIIRPFFQPLIPKSFHYFLDQLIYKIFTSLNLLSPAGKIDYTKASLRTTVFIDEAKKHGIICKHLISPFGPTNHFQIEINNKNYFFEGLPRMEMLENKTSELIDDKYAVKKLLQNSNFPTPEGKSFWWFQENPAAQYGISLNFPLVVKPRLGSMSQHTTINVNNIKDLESAIKKTLNYSPAFIVEKFLPNTHTYRATVIDFKNIACVKRIPAYVIGANQHTIQELINIKNSDPRRGNPRQKDTTLYKLVTDETSNRLLKKSRYSYKTILKDGERFYLQEKIILDLGADLQEETPNTHPDNLNLFQNVAKLFNTRLVGIDFLIDDISNSWKSKPSAVIELNSLPYIDMHHFPTDGTPTNIAKYLCEAVKKHYS